MKSIRKIISAALVIEMIMISIPGLSLRSDVRAEDKRPVTTQNEETVDFQSLKTLDADAQIVESGTYDTSKLSDPYMGTGLVDYVLYDDGTLTLDGHGQIAYWRAPAGTKKAIVGENVFTCSDWELGSGYFGNCTTLETVILPSTTGALGGFGGCTSLSKIYIPDDASITQIHEGAFSGCTSLKSLTIPDTVQFIGGSAFNKCGITKLTLPSSLTYGYEMLFGSNISTVVFNGSKLYKDLFIGADSLTTIILGQNIKSIVTGAFAGCEEVNNIIFLNNYDYNSKLFDPMTYAFIYRKSGSSSVTLEEFTGSTKRVSVPSKVAGYTVSKIGDYAFDGNKSVRSISLPSTIQSIQGYAFYSCSKLSSVTLQNGLKSVGKFAFYGCNSLTSLALPSTVTSIGSYAFWHCYSLTSLTLPESITSIGSNAFESCTGLTSVSIGTAQSGSGTAQSGGSNRLSSLLSLNVYAASKSKPIAIKKNAFKKCSRLKKLIIGKKVGSIGGYAFYNCKSLKVIKLTTKKLTSKKIGSKAFKGIYKKAKIYVPKTKLKAYKKILKKKGAPKKAIYKKL